MQFLYRRDRVPGAHSTGCIGYLNVDARHDGFRLHCKAFVRGDPAGSARRLTKLGNTETGRSMHPEAFRPTTQSSIMSGTELHFVAELKDQSETLKFASCQIFLY